MIIKSARFKNLDDPEFISNYLLRVDAKKVNQKVISEKKFEEAFAQIVLNRIMQNEFDNPYSKFAIKSTIDLKPLNKQLFLNMFSYAMQKKAIEKIELLYNLCYLKQEQISFVNAFVDALKPNKIEATELEHESHYTNDNLSQYLIESEKTYSKIFGVTVWKHLSRTLRFDYQNNTKTFRSVSKKNWELGTIYVSDSTADCIIFDESINFFDAVLTLPGLKLRDLSSEYLIKIIELCHKVFNIKDCDSVKLILNVGFVDKIRIASSMNQIDHISHEYEVKKIIDDVVSNLKNLNQNNNKIKVILQNSTFPACEINKTKINGLVRYFPSNTEASGVIDKILAMQVDCIGEYQCFKPGAKTKIKALIHEREIHPKLGLKVKSL